MFNYVARSKLALWGPVLLLGATAMAQAEEVVDLIWFPVSEPVNAGDTFEIALIARSATGADIPMSGLSVILNWDPTKLELQGVNNNGPYDWFSSGFSDVFDLDNFNATFSDGDAYYLSLSNFLPSPPAEATPSGLLVTSFVFRALESGLDPVLAIPRSAGEFSDTIVASGTVPGLNILGELVPEPASLGLLALGGFVMARFGRRSLRGPRRGAKGVGNRAGCGNFGGRGNEKRN